MGFTLPDFNLVCDIWTGPWSTKVLRSAGVECNLAWGKRGGPVLSFLVSDPSANGVNANMTLLLPAGTDVRAFPTYPVSDFLEVPQGSGRWYMAVFVDDAGKGFSNEHRIAVMSQISATVDASLFAGLTWPVPMP